jgi:hypothetical protein
MVYGQVTISRFSNKLLLSKFFSCLDISVGRDSSVGITARYRLDGPGIESQLWGDFPHQFRLALGPTQPPTQYIDSLFRG